MTAVDTSREAVERAAEWCSSNAKLFTIDLAGEDDEGRACKLRLRQQAHLNAAATLRALLDERDRLRDALRTVIAACDSGRLMARGAGGQTMESTLSRLFIHGVPARPIEDARAALNERGQDNV